MIPTPASPIIKSVNPEDYIKSSNYPIPYQAMIAVEGANTHELLTWDINVTTQNVKVKIEWSVLDGSTSVKSDSIPKTVINSISLYNLTQPSWSTSYSTKKFSFKCDWKLVSTKSTFNNSFCPSTPLNSKSPNDSGYISNTSKSLNTSTPYTPSHNRSHRHDVYKPPFKQPVFYRDSPTKDIPSPKPTFSSTHQSSFTHISPPSSTNQDTSLLPPTEEPPPPPKSPSSPKLPNTLPAQNHSLPKPNLPIDPNPKSDSLPKTSDPIPNPPASSSSTNDPNPKSSNPIANLPTTDPNLPNTTAKPTKSLPDIHILPSPRKFVASDQSRDGEIYSILDPDAFEFSPGDETFLQSPETLPINSPGLIDSDIRADRMNIQGKCRLCKSDVASYQADAHLLECRRLDQFDIDDLAHEYADITHSSYNDIINVIFQYCDYVMHDEDVSYYFSKMSTFEKFLHDLESLLDRRATKVYRKMQITGHQRRFNILDYSQKS